MKGDCEVAGVQDTVWMATEVVAEDVLTAITMLLPNATSVPMTARSGEIAPLNT